MQDIDQFDCKTFEKVKGKQLYKINKNQFLKLNHKGEGSIIAPARDPITKKRNWNNIFFTGGTVWGLIKVILITLFLVFLLWRYSVEMKDCIDLRKYYDPYTGCLDDEFFESKNLSISNSRANFEDIAKDLMSKGFVNDAPEPSLSPFAQKERG